MCVQVCKCGNVEMGGQVGGSGRWAEGHCLYMCVDMQLQKQKAKSAKRWGGAEKGGGALGQEEGNLYVEWVLEGLRGAYTLWSLHFHQHAKELGIHWNAVMRTARLYWMQSKISSTKCLLIF